MFGKWIAALAVAPALAGAALADGIVSQIVNAPLSATGTVKGARTGINVYLQSEAAPGIEFMNPEVIGYGVPPGGRLEVEMGGGYERDWAIGISQAAIMLVTGAPQQGLPGMKLGYQVGEEEDENVFVITPVGDDGLPPERLMSPAPGAALDPIPNRGIKVIHIGFRQSAFLNAGDRGTVTVRILDGEGRTVAQGGGEIAFIDRPVPQILPTNFPQGMRNHNWQRVHPGDTLGETEGTLPLTFMLYDAAPTTDRDEMYAFKAGIVGVGALSPRRLSEMGFQPPAALSGFNGGLLVRDTNGDGRLDPAEDRIIGGVIDAAPEGATGQELRSMERDGAPLLSQPTEAVAPKPGKRWGGAMLQLAFTAGSKPGLYRPTVALLKDPERPEAGIGSAYAYTVVVE